MLWLLMSVGAALLSYLWFFRNEVKPETVKKEVDKIADKVVEKAEEAKEKVEEKIQKEESLRLDKTASERSTHTALEKTVKRTVMLKQLCRFSGKKDVEPRPTQVVTAGLGSENEAPAQVQSANVVVSDPPKDVATAREQLASELELGSALPTATQQNNKVVLDTPSRDAARQPTSPIVNPISAPAEVNKEEAKPKDESLHLDVTQKPEQSMQVDVTQKPLDPVVEKVDKKSSKSKRGKKKKHKKHKHKKSSNREGSKKKKKSKRSKKNGDVAASGLNEQPNA